MSDGKIHIPARRKQPVDDQMVVKVTPEEKFVGYVHQILNRKKLKNRFRSKC